jgi:hypothetical protein
MNTVAAFIIAQVVAIGMLFTAVIVLDKSLTNKLSVTGMISLRCGFSIYTGWLCVANILNISFVMKSLGFSEASNPDINETLWTVGTMIAAEGVYVFVSYMMRNPLYACVWIWAMSGIRDESSAYADIVTTANVLLICHGCYIVGLTTYLIVNKIK